MKGGNVEETRLTFQIFFLTNILKIVGNEKNMCRVLRESRYYSHLVGWTVINNYSLYCN